MRAAAVAYMHDAVRGVTPFGADFVDAARKLDLAAQLQTRRPWVKLYSPTEEGEEDITEAFLVTIDCGAIDPESARATAEAVRSGLASNRRDPQHFHRVRIAALDEGNFHRVQLTYRVRRPAT
jgi:hypothetical protein